MERPWNVNVLTMDGMHFSPTVNVEMGWDLLSWWAEKVVGKDV